MTYYQKACCRSLYYFLFHSVHCKINDDWSFKKNTGSRKEINKESIIINGWPFFIAIVYFFIQEDTIESWFFLFLHRTVISENIRKKWNHWNELQINIVITKLNANLREYNNFSDFISFFSIMTSKVKVI